MDRRRANPDNTDVKGTRDMLIVVEGPDGSGKTTLVRSAREHAVTANLITLTRNGPAPMPDMVQTLFWIQSYPPSAVLICDRIASISERVYGPILRGTNLFEKHPLEFGIGRVDAIIYCRPPDIKILTGSCNEPQLTGVSSNITKIIDAYDDLMERIVNELEIQVYTYDYTKTKPDQVWPRVLGKAPANPYQELEVGIAFHRDPSKVR
jgi:hypothetical protein